MTEPTPLSAEQPYSRDELVHLAENMRHSIVQQIVGATGQKTINRLFATIDAQAAEIAALRGALERLLPLTEEFEYTLYGNFMGGDPREFSPDEEVCLPEEIAAWKSACEEWNRGEGVDRGPGCQTMGDGWAGTGTGFGLGTTIRKCAEREEAKRVLAGKEAQG